MIRGSAMSDASESSVTVCCGVVQCVAVCCSEEVRCLTPRASQLLQYAAMYCSEGGRARAPWV